MACVARLVDDNALTKLRLHRTSPFLYRGVEVESRNQAVMDLPRDREQVGHESGDALGKLRHVGMTVQIAQRDCRSLLQSRSTD